MTKIVINGCYGGFGLSTLAMERLRRRGVTETYHGDIARDNPHLVAVVEELGTKAHDSLASLKIVEIPDDVEWEVEEYDGNERVAEKHRTWYG